MKGLVIRILGTKVSAIKVQDLHAYIGSQIRQGGHVVIPYVNAHGLNLAYEQPWLREFINRSEVVICDGIGVLLAARLFGARIPQRITYADWMWQLGDFAASRGFSMFLLGGRPGVAEQAARNLQASFTNIRIAGTQHGFFDKTAGHPENTAVISRISSTNPDILVVGFGMPIQERWLDTHWPEICARVALPAGAALDYTSGKLRRAPDWMTDHGLEWLGRLFIEPGRLWKRYLLGNLVFIGRVIRQRIGLMPGRVSDTIVGGQGSG